MTGAQIIVLATPVLWHAHALDPFAKALGGVGIVGLLVAVAALTQPRARTAPKVEAAAASATRSTTSGYSGTISWPEPRRQRYTAVRDVTPTGWRRQVRVGRRIARLRQRMCRIYSTNPHRPTTTELQLDLARIGQRVRERRESVGLSQQRLARLSGLSRATINQLETGVLIELGVNKLSFLLGLLGLRLEAEALVSRRRALSMASRTASVSYKTPLEVRQLTKALVTGELPENLVPQISSLLDEAPLSLLVAAVEEAARLGGVPPRQIWRHLVRWAGDLRSPRQAWA